jgi:hypothetical protein
VRIDSSVMEANASLRGLVNRNTAEAYWEYVKRLAAQSGIDSLDTAAVRKSTANGHQEDEQSGMGESAGSGRQDRTQERRSDGHDLQTANRGGFPGSPNTYTEGPAVSMPPWVPWAQQPLHVNRGSARDRFESPCDAHRYLVSGR